jgi:hypothetical protein
MSVRSELVSECFGSQNQSTDYFIASLTNPDCGWSAARGLFTANNTAIGVRLFDADKLLHGYVQETGVKGKANTEAMGLRTDDTTGTEV